jgi:hypothetical protein
MSLIESSSSLRAAAVDLLWAQWTELGVGGTRGTSAATIDPESLLVATTVFGRYDPRLFDQVLEWLALHSAVLDVTRLRRVSESRVSGDRRLLGALIAYMSERVSSGKWTRTVDQALRTAEERAPYAPQALFLAADGSALPTFGSQDSFFASHGFERPAFEPRPLSSPPDPRRPALARLRLRALAGHGVRAESLLYLGSHDHAHGRLVAERSAYSQRQVAEYLAGLREAGLAEAWMDGRRQEYRLHPDLAAVAASESNYVDWIGVFGLVTTLWVAVRDAAREADPYASSTMLRPALESMRNTLPIEGFELPLPEPGRYPGARLLDHAVQFAAAVTERIRQLAG